MDPPTERPTTRAKNANQHPGMIGQTRKRRTKAEIARDEALLLAKKEAEKKRKDEGIARVAQMEDKMAINDANVRSAHPRSRKDLHHGITSHGIKRSSVDEIERPEKHMPRKEGTAQMAGHRAVIEDLQKVGDNAVGQKRKRSGNANGEPPMSHSETTDKDDDEGIADYLLTKASRVVKKIPSQKMQQVRDRADVALYLGRQGEKPKAQGKTHPQAKQIMGEGQPTTKRYQSDGSDSELTDLGDDPTPKKERSSLKRSYALDDIAAIQLRQGMYDGTFEDVGYEPPSEPERDLGVTALDGDYCEDNDHDDNPTPKKRQKTVKVPVRETIGANRKEAEPRKERSKVCDDESNTTTKTSKGSFGLIKNWASKVDAKTSRAPTAIRTATSTTAVSTGRTTALSNAVVIPAKKVTTKSIKSQPLDDDTASRFLEEDEAIEREAALSSPIKGKQRLSSAAIVKIEPVSPPPKHTNSRKTNADLPPGALDNAIWRRVFIPTYIQYLASRKVEDTWAIDDDDAIALLQKVWDFLYGARIEHIVSVGAPVFSITDQRMCEWRSGFASAALTILHAIFEDNNINTDDERWAFANDALQGFSFLYRDIKEENGMVTRKGIFGGELVVRTFAAHFTTIRGAVDVPNTWDPARPAIALALSASGAERALQLWHDKCISCETLAEHKAKKRSSPIIKKVNQTTGKPSTKQTDFNQANWNAITNSYLLSIKKRLSNRKFDTIIEAATEISNATRRPEASSTVPDEDLADERACLIADDSDSDSD